MKLIEALNTVEAMKRRGGEPFTCFVATGFNPLHLKTFLAAELSLLFPDQRIEIQEGLYGDFAGNLARMAKSGADSGIVLMEWSDLDSRLGIRSTAAWSSSTSADILATARARAAEVQKAVVETRPGLPLALCLPTLPLPPLSYVPGWQAGSLEIDLQEIVRTLAGQVYQQPQVRVLSPQRIESASPLSQRLDIEADLRSGFPYRLAHASALATPLARLVRKPTPKKGLITDLDDTLWRGILGEAGVEGISWDLDHHSQMHAYYQRFLAALASEGVLLAVASKNESSLVEKALTRRDLALPAAALFPIEAHWGPKSESVARILKAWNIAPDSVVFVDDSPLELAEVKASQPEMECIQFPTQDSAAIYDLTLRLRDYFGKSAVLEEDSIRAASIRRSQAVVERPAPAAATPSHFLEQVEAEISFDFSKTPLDPRALELVNKTNQFNLNGKRYSEAAWHNYFLDPESILGLVSYTDKYGPLGKIAVLAGRRAGKTLTVDTWVMSCRAFSRGIEYRCLEELFARWGVDQIELAFTATGRNKPLEAFLNEVLGGPPFPGCRVGRAHFLAKCPQSLQGVEEVTYG